MPGDSLIHDTNAFIAWMRRDPDLVKVLKSESPPVLTLVTLGELYYGVSNSAREEENRGVLELALKDADILIPDRGTALIYGSLRTKMRRAGRPIPANDVWIAALALQHGFPLLTRDSHFNDVESLRIQTW